jgi:hypothetical protein
MNFDVTEVFTPADQPTHTYVDRSDLRLVDRVTDAFDTPNMIVSVSGPSKTGKTVLIKKCIDSDWLIPLFGGAIGSIGDFWRALFAWIEIPEIEINNTSTNWGIGAGVSALTEAGVIIAKVKGGISTSIERSTMKSTQKTKRLTRFNQL